jgi:histidinol-phosphate aminotransferase
MSDILHLVRPQVLAMQPYLPPESEEGIRLNANESAWRSEADISIRGLNRYPDPYPETISARLARMYGVDAGQLALTRGSDEAIDLLLRLFCREGVDSIVICPPTFGMYRVYAQVQGAAVIEVPLEQDQGFGLDPGKLLAACEENTKLVFLCSPNNPTGQLLDEAAVFEVCRGLLGRAVVVVDEAYVEFADRASLIDSLEAWPNLVILRTLSKAYGLAGARLGALISSVEITDLFKRVVPPYALSTPVLEAGDALLCPAELQELEQRIKQISQLRDGMARELEGLKVVRKVWPSDANFILISVDDAAAVDAAFARAGILIRNFSREPGLENCLRITVGTPEQNAAVMAVLSEQNNGGAG